jgi:hypothetical protein
MVERAEVLRYARDRQARAWAEAEQWGEILMVV